LRAATRRNREGASDVFNILLQVMDHGKLTDHSGKQIDFRNVILIMTTNAGAQDMAREAFGFHRKKREGEDTEAINKLFTPEFRNRLDAIVPFGRLPIEVIARVVDKFILQLEAQLADRNVSIELSDEARSWLVTAGYDDSMGARPMARVIQTEIKTPLADEVLFGKLKGGGVVRVVVTADDTGVKKLGFVYPAGPAQPQPERDILVAGRGRAKADADKKTKARKRAEDDEPSEVDPSSSEPQAT
jgi:ATP-dependent Clp protease ATP-binding subunit ClpA